MAKKISNKRLHGRWWNAPDENVHMEVIRTANAIRQSNVTMREWHKTYLQMYGRLDPNGGFIANATGFQNVPNAANGRTVKYNLTVGCVDTAASIIASAKPMPQFQTELGNWELSMRARERTRVLDGQFADIDAFRLGREVFYGALTGTSFAYIYFNPATGKVETESVLSLEMDIDQNEARLSRHPRNWFRRHVVGRDDLYDMFPKKASIIDDAGGPDEEEMDDFFLNRDTQADQVRLIEGWHLPGPDGKGGRHVIVCSSGTLLDEEWTAPRAPFAVYRWKVNPGNKFWGIGIPEEVAPSQREINAHIDNILQHQRLMSGGHLLLEGNSQVRVEKVSNLPGQAIRFTGARPEWHVHSGTPMDLQAQVQLIEERVMRQLGLSPGSMQGTKEPGVDSGVALRTLQDIKSLRHSINAENYSDFFKELAQCIVDCNDRVAEDDDAYEVNQFVSRGRTTFLKGTKWIDLKLPEGKVNWTMAQVNSFPQTPAGRLQMVEDYISNQFIDRQWAMKLLDLPDTSDYLQLELAELEHVLWEIERLLDGEPVLPAEYADPQFAATTVRKALLRAEINGAPDHVIDNFLSYLSECEAMIADQVSAEPSPQPPAPPPAPEGAAAMMGALGAGQPMQMPSV